MADKTFLNLMVGDKLVVSDGHLGALEYTIERIEEHGIESSTIYLQDVENRYPQRAIMYLRVD